MLKFFIFGGILEKAPDHQASRYNTVAHACEHKGEHEKAKEYYDKAEAIVPGLGLSPDNKGKDTSNPVSKATMKPAESAP